MRHDIRRRNNRNFGTINAYLENNNRNFEVFAEAHNKVNERVTKLERKVSTSSTINGLHLILTGFLVLLVSKHDKVLKEHQRSIELLEDMARRTEDRLRYSERKTD